MTTIDELYRYHINQNNLAIRKFSDKKLHDERFDTGDAAYYKSCGRSFNVLDKLLVLDIFHNMDVNNA